MDFTTHHKNQGIVLISVLIILLSLTLIALTVSRRNTMDEMMAANLRDASNTMTIAESGIEAGFALVEQNHVHGQVIMDDLFQLPGNVLSQYSISGGNYEVTAIDGIPSDGIATLNSVGQFNGSVREIEILLEMQWPSRAAYAILTNDDIISIEGSPEINGPFADVHSNSDVNIQGNPTVSGEVSASGNVNITGNPTIGATVSGAGLVDIPHVYPPEYRQYATIVLGRWCKIYDGAGNLIGNVTGGGKWHGWTCDGGDNTWTVSGNTQPDGWLDGYYYVEGNVVLGGGPNGLWLVTIIAEGSIHAAGNSIFQPWASQYPNDTGDPEANEILFLAGNDLRIEGTPGNEFRGIMAAHMEVGVSGNADLSGSIVAENGLHAMGQEVVTDSRVVTNLIDTNYFSGNLSMEASGTGLGAIKQLTVTAWRELVH